MPRLAAGQSAQLTIQALVTQPGNITNLAVKTGGNEPDPNPGNDSGAATINAAAAADVAVQKTADDTTPVGRPERDLHRDRRQPWPELRHRRI